MALKKSVSSSTLLTIIVGFKPADSSKRRLDTDAEAKTILGIAYAFFRAPKVILLDNPCRS
jgi:ABC-type branched-subunit amino acid transport system ATPase component